MHIDFLTYNEVRAIHVDQIDRYGGAHGIRDDGLLQSALAQPMISFGGKYVHGDLFEMAAAYLFHLVQNHPFIDGNKRVGLVAALIFLHLNGFHVQGTTEETEDMVIAVASGKFSKREIAGWLESHALQ